MLELDPNHPLIKMYREWKKWETIQSSGRGQFNRNAGEEPNRIAAGGAGNGLPEPASLAELQFWGEMRNNFQARFEGELRTYLAANSEMTQESVERELDALLDA